MNAASDLIVAGAPRAASSACREFPATIGEQSLTAIRLGRPSFRSATVAGRRSNRCRPMPLLRRLTALLSSLLLLQLSLLGADWPCGSHVGSADRAHVGATPAPHASHSSHDAAPTHAPSDACEAERTPGECRTMPSCATTLGVPERVVAEAVLLPTSSTLPQPLSIQSQPATGPDVPPPRG